MTAVSHMPIIRSIRRGPVGRLRDALLRLAEYQAQLLAQNDEPWASVTYTGARHSFTLLFAGDDGVDAGERFVATLPEHEFTIPGHLVADAEVVEVEHRIVPSPRLIVHCEVLMLEES